MADKSTGDSVKDAGQKAAQVVEVALSTPRGVQLDLTCSHRARVAATTASLTSKAQLESISKVRTCTQSRSVVDICIADGAIGSVGESIGGPLSSEGGSLSSPD